MGRLEWTLTLEEPLRPGDLLRLMQDIAGADADRRGCGRSDLLRHGCVWVLIKNRVEILRRPQTGESVTLTTWPMQGRRGFYPRGYELYGADGATLLRAESQWAVLEVERRVMSTLEACGVGMSGVEESPFRPVARLRIPEGGESFAFTPRPEQIDVNHHMNNAAYPRMLLGAFSGRELRDMELREMELCFRVPCYEGEELTLRRRTIDGGLEAAAFRPDGKAALLARLLC